MRPRGTVDDYLAACSDRGLRPRTIQAKARVLHGLAATTPESTARDATEDAVRAWWRRLRDRGTGNTWRATCLSHAREYYRWLQAEGLRDDDPTRRIRRPVVHRGRPRDVDPGRVLDLLDDLAGRGETRPWAVIGLALWCGLRCCEIAPVRPGRDLRRGDGHWTLVVTGKGGHWRGVHVPDDLADWLHAAGKWAFPSPRRPGPVTADTVSRVGARALRSGGIDATMHQLRHTHATALYEDTRDLLMVGEQLGHRSSTSTQVYARAAGPPPGVVAGLYRAAVRGRAGR